MIGQIHWPRKIPVCLWTTFIHISNVWQWYEDELMVCIYSQQFSGDKHTAASPSLALPRSSSREFYLLHLLEPEMRKGRGCLYILTVFSFIYPIQFFNVTLNFGWSYNQNTVPKVCLLFDKCFMSYSRLFHYYNGSQHCGWRKLGSGHWIPKTKCRLLQDLQTYTQRGNQRELNSQWWIGVRHIGILTTSAMEASTYKKTTAWHGVMHTCEIELKFIDELRWWWY